MSKDLDRPLWRGQRPWFEIYFAVLLDESRRRALWIRHELTVPKEGAGKATIWGAWFDADATLRSRATKRFATLDQVEVEPSSSAADSLRPAASADQLIRIDDCTLSRGGAIGNVPGLAWDVRWQGGKDFGRELPAWLPAPTHARGLVHDADVEGTISIDDKPVAIRGRALAMHLWGNRRVPTLHWIWAPWLAGHQSHDVGSLEVTAVSLRDRLSLGLSSLTLDGPHPLSGTPATAAHPHGLITATVAGARRLIHLHAWAEPDELVGYAYRDTDDRDLMVAQSDIGSAHFEQFARKAPGAVWHLTEERRSAGGVAVEIHQRAPLPGVDYIAWDATTRTKLRPKLAPPRGDVVDWPEVTSITALGLTYADHIKETGGTVDKSAPPIAFEKHLRSFLHPRMLGAAGEVRVRVPDTTDLLTALEELEPGLSGQIKRAMPLIPAIMDYEGEIALVALDTIDDTQVTAGGPLPFGLAACNDLTARICQVFGEGKDASPRDSSSPRDASTPSQHDYWAVAKSFPHFLPVAEQLWVPPDGITRMPDVTIITRVNGEERQHASTKHLIYDLPRIVRAARMHLGRPLQRGDVILTGTPAGVGMRLSRVKRRLARLVKDRFRKAELLISTYATSNALLRPGDVVEVEAGPAGSVRTRLIV